MNWEYFCFELDYTSDPTALLNDYGKGGWELIAALQTVPAVGSNWKSRFLMKRKLERKR